MPILTCGMVFPPGNGGLSANRLLAEYVMQAFIDAVRGPGLEFPTPHFLIGDLTLAHGFWVEAHVDIAELMVNTVHLDGGLDGLEGGKGFLDGHRVVAEHVDSHADGAGLDASGIEVIGLATDFSAGVGLPLSVGAEGGE